MNLVSKFVIFVVLALMCSSCHKTATTNPPNALNTGATITLDLAKSLRLVEDGIRQANSVGIADNATTAAVLRLTTRLNQAGLQADTVLRSQATLSATQKTNLITLLSPLVQAIQNSVDIDIIKISNPNTQNQIKSALLAMQLTIKTTLAALGGN